MKKLILKTAFLTIGVTIILAVAVFGIASFSAPAAMMELSLSLGLESIGGDYAFQEYERSGDLYYLVRAFEISATDKRDEKADDRFTVLYGESGSARREEFSAYCESYELPEGTGAPVDYRAYLCALAARVKCRLAKTNEEKSAVCAFALSETDESFPAGNPAIALAVEAASRNDAEFCSLILDALDEGVSAVVKAENTDYCNIVKILEEVK